MSKYELTEETRQVADHTLHRIRATRTFGGVKEGALGGWIESKDNLSQDGDCWVSDEAYVYDDAQVYGNAKVSSNAQVNGSAVVCGNAHVFDYAQVYGNAKVYCNAQVFGDAVVCGNAHVSDDAWVFGGAKVSGSACVYGNARVFDFAIVCGSARVDDYARVYGNAEVWEGEVCGRAEIGRDARIGGIADYTVIWNSWSSGRWITYTRSNRMWKVGCFYGTGKQLIEKAYKDGDIKGWCYETIVRAVEQIEDEVIMAGLKKEKDNG